MRIRGLHYLIDEQGCDPAYISSLSIGHSSHVKLACFSCQVWVIWRPRFFEVRFKEAIQRFTWWKCSVWCCPVSNEYRAFELSSLRQFTNEPFGTCLVCIFIDWWIACDKIRPNNSLQQDRCPYVSFQGMLFVSKYDQTYNSTYILNLSATHLINLRLGKFLPWNPEKIPLEKLYKLPLYLLDFNSYHFVAIKVRCSSLK